MIRTNIKYRSILALTIFFFKNKNSFYPATRLFDRRKIQTWQTIAEFEWFQTGEWRLEKEGERSPCQRLFSPPRTRLVSRQRKKRRAASEGEGRNWRGEARKRCEQQDATLQPGRPLSLLRDPRLERSPPRRNNNVTVPVFLNYNCAERQH